MLNLMYSAHESLSAYLFYLLPHLLTRGHIIFLVPSLVKVIEHKSETPLVPHIRLVGIHILLKLARLFVDGVVS